MLEAVIPGPGSERLQYIQEQHSHNLLKHVCITRGEIGNFPILQQPVSFCSVFNHSQVMKNDVLTVIKEGTLREITPIGQGAMSTGVDVFTSHKHVPINSKLSAE